MTGQLYAFPRHVLMGTRQCPCDCGGSTERMCLICEGGLAFCVACGGAEGSLPTCCPGEQMQEVVCDEVYYGALDYDARRGWHQKLITGNRRA